MSGGAALAPLGTELPQGASDRRAVYRRRLRSRIRFWNGCRTVRSAQFQALLHAGVGRYRGRLLPCQHHARGASSRSPTRQARWPSSRRRWGRPRNERAYVCHPRRLPRRRRDRPEARAGEEAASGDIGAVLRGASPPTAQRVARPLHRPADGGRVRFRTAMERGEKSNMIHSNASHYSHSLSLSIAVVAFPDCD